MDLALLRTFLAVHRAGSFTRAAQLLGLSQPAVTGQIRTLERQFGRRLFHRLPRGVEPTSVAAELAERIAPHLDALTAITGVGAGAEEAGSLHLAAPSEFSATYLLPALAPLIAGGLTLRVTAAHGDAAVAGLADAAYDMVVCTRRPRAQLFRATPLFDEEHVLVAAPRWAEELPTEALPAGTPGADAEGELGKAREALENLPVIDVDEALPFTTRYWNAVFDCRPTRPAALVAPDLRGALAAARAGAGMAVLPRRLCAQALANGELVALLAPPVPPLRTFFLVVRAGSLGRPAIARAHARLITAAAGW